MYATKNLQKECKLVSTLDIIKKEVETLRGYILTDDEMRDRYKEIAFEYLGEQESISYIKLKEVVGYSCWKWFLNKYGDCVRSDDSVNYTLFS